MADAQQVTSVMDNLPPDSGWDTAKITAYLDTPLSVNRTIMAFWTSKAAATSNFINVNESGSNRDFTRVHDNAVAQSRFWLEQAQAEELKADEDRVKLEEQTRTRSAVRRITRV